MAEWYAGAFVAAGGALLTAQSVPPYVRALRSRAWPRARGTVERGGLAAGVLMGRHPPLAVSTPAVRYRYAVGGAEFTGARLRYGAALPWEARRAAERGAVEVAYDPRDPAESVLLPGPSALATLGVLASGALLVGGLWWLADAAR